MESIITVFNSQLGMLVSDTYPTSHCCDKGGKSVSLLFTSGKKPKNLTTSPGLRPRNLILLNEGEKDD